MKRWFITVYLLMLVGLLLLALSKLDAPGAGLAALGLALGAGAPLAFFGWLMLARPARTDAHPVLVSVISGLGAVLTMGAVYRYGEQWQPFLLGAVLALAGWQIYLRWYSRQPRPTGIPVPGQPLPAFELSDSEGRTVSSRSLAGRAAILLFYRGNWCPLCTAQIRELAAQWREIERRGAELWLISSQSQQHTRAIAERFDIPARFLRDVDNRAARSLGIEAPGAAPAGMELLGYPADAALPTVVVVDADGIVRFIEVAANYRLRPDPGIYLSALDNSRR
ncbi:MAG: peroxiredoxin family protein [Wenzhouxiangellaceae bacterium]|nr:peroxiredoxin family protein [Wenzhouxiangellaceae bacterium]